MKNLENKILGIIAVAVAATLSIFTIIDFPELTNIYRVWDIVLITICIFMSVKLLFNIFPKWKWLAKQNER